MWRKEPEIEPQSTSLEQVDRVGILEQVEPNAEPDGEGRWTDVVLSCFSKRFHVI